MTSSLSIPLASLHFSLLLALHYAARGPMVITPPVLSTKMKASDASAIFFHSVFDNQLLWYHQASSLGGARGFCL